MGAALARVARVVGSLRQVAPRSGVSVNTARHSDTDDSGMCPIGRSADLHFLAWLRSATLEQLSAKYRLELRLGDAGEEWRLVALEREGSSPSTLSARLRAYVWRTRRHLLDRQVQRLFGGVVLV